jgi:hypothetical protein
MSSASICLFYISFIYYFLNYISKMTAIAYTLFHSAPVPNTPCPFCHWINNPSAGPLGMPGMSLQQAQDSPSQAQYTPAAPGTVANLRQAIYNGNTYRAAKAAAVPTTPGTRPPLSVTRVYVRVAHAYYSDTTPPPLRRNGPSLQMAGLLLLITISLSRLMDLRRRFGHKGRLSTSTSLTILPSLTARAIGRCQPIIWTLKPPHHSYGAPGRASFVFRTQSYCRITLSIALVPATARAKHKLFRLTL